MNAKELKLILRDLDSYDFGELFDVTSDLISEVARLLEIEKRAQSQSEDVQVNWLSPIEAAALRATVARLRAALETVEWDTSGIGDRAWDMCPWCGNYRSAGHRADCQRQVALKESQS
jgi:hypothetical protein